MKKFEVAEMKVIMLSRSTISTTPEAEEYDQEYEEQILEEKPIITSLI